MREEVSDDDLMRLYAGGEREAFDALFDRHHASVYHFARTMLGAEAPAEEVLQETFLAVARAAGNYRTRGRFRAWLMRICRNRCLNRLQARRARRAALGPDGASAEAVAADDPGPPERLDGDERTERVRAAVDALPERQREAVTLRAFDGMSYREIAETLEMPVNTVKTLLHRARAALARALAGPDGEVRS